MKITIRTICITLLFLASGLSGTVTAQAPENESPRGSGLPVLHPEITLLDNGGAVRRGTVTIEEVSTVNTCGKCHDTEYINDHNSHFTGEVKVGCLACHLRDVQLGDNPGEVHKRIQLPDSRNCAPCHGLVSVDSTPLVIPGDFDCIQPDAPGSDHYKMTRHTGVIIAAQDLSNSALNLKNKQQLHFPWDVHARRQLKCIDCHFISNDPRYCGEDLPELGHLRRDPRKIKSPGEILMRPDHFLKASSCTCCHDPFAIHNRLPYKKRHIELLRCQSCHVPRIYGPALQTVDSTVLTTEGEPHTIYRGTDKSHLHGGSMNTAFLEGYRPFLFPLEKANRFNREETKISPFNLVTRWYWKSGKSSAPLPLSILRQVYLEDSNPGIYSRDILESFDSDGSGTLDEKELRLDTHAKLNLIKTRLQDLGVEDPQIAGTVESHLITHGVLSTSHMELNCSDCHEAGSRFGRDVPLAAYAPGGVVPEFIGDDGPIINGSVRVEPGGPVVLRRSPGIAGFYVLGHHRSGILDNIGIWVFILSLLAIAGHGFLRYVSALKHPPHPVKTVTVYMYRFYERLWHWTMASAILLLGVTGLEIHYNGVFNLFGLEYAVPIHNILAAILVANAALSLFYHLTTGAIKHFFGFNNKFVKESIVQAYYYVYGIFKRHPHPINKTTDRKLNPLQQLTYIFLLNLLLPFQVVTGLLMWGAERWPLLSESLGGLVYLAPMHNLGAWLLLAFIVAHVYLTTTGHTVFANIRAMITGYDEVAETEKNEEYHRMMEMKLADLVGTLISRSKGSKNDDQEQEETNR